MGKSGSFQVFSQLLTGVGIFLMLFKGAFPHIPPALEQIHTIRADIGFFVKFPPPNTVDIIILIQKDLTVHGAELFWGIHIKDEDTAGVQGFVYTPDRFFAVIRVKDIVKAVQRANRKINTLRQSQLLQRLAHELGTIFQISALIRCHSQHFRGNIHSSYA